MSQKLGKKDLLMKKICFTAKTNEGNQTYKFGVFSTNSWLKSIENAIDENKNQ